MDTSKDEGGWMLVINTGAKTSHTNLVTAIGTLPVLPTQTTVGKLSDSDINALRGTTLLNSIIRLDRPNNPTFSANPMYLEKVYLGLLMEQQLLICFIIIIPLTLM
jgi:hypothetical protein